MALDAGRGSWGEVNHAPPTPDPRRPFTGIVGAVTKRRYEVLLPARLNDGRSVLLQETSNLQQSLQEVIERFGAMSYNPNTVLGVYHKGRETFEDDLYQLVVDVDDTPENRRFFLEFKQKLKGRFQQLEIYVVTYPVEVL